MSDQIVRAHPERIALCDLLWGRMFRSRASVFLEDALALERLGVPRSAVEEVLHRAAHAEWLASISEKGIVAWGDRVNRCSSPEDPCPGE